MNRFFTWAIGMIGVVVALACLPARGEVKLPALFSDHMVLQQEMSAPVWGWADAGEEVAVSIDNESATTKANADGKWSLKLPPLKASGPHTLTIKGKNSVTITDVLVGEVWLGSGQSNMAMTVNRANDYEKEQAASNLPNIRMFTVTSGAASEAQENCTGKWVVCSPDAVGTFSATLFFCGREIHKKLGVPVGLINSSVGGTPIESWVSEEAQSASPDLKKMIDDAKRQYAKFDAAAATARYEKDLAKWKEEAAKAKAAKQRPPQAPRDPVAIHKRKGNIGGLFNGKIAPLIPYGLRGALWYQGEGNANGERADYYGTQLRLLVTDWRKRWGSEFPMAWVQLPNFNSRGSWPVVREQMLESLVLPKTGMAITIDIGDPKDIHPANKQDVGKRLAAWALATVYEQKGIASSGPLPAGHETKGREIAVRFKHTDGGLVAKGGELKGFEICGSDKAWKPASARIEGEQVFVTNADVAQPVAVRYAWKDNPDCNLYNGAGLPASPFRTEKQ